MPETVPRGTVGNDPLRNEILSDMSESGGSPRDLTPPQVTALQGFFSDKDVGLWHFNREIMGFRDLYFPVHGPLCQFVGHWGESHLADGRVITEPPGDEEVDLSFRRLMVRIPREFFKTSCVTRGATLWTLATVDHDATFGIFNEKEDNTISWIEAICQVVENSTLFQALWREMIPRGIGYWDKDRGIGVSKRSKWGGNGIRFERSTHGVSELSVEGHGVGGATAGKHFTHSILDDIIGLKAIREPSTMMAAMEWIDHKRPLERPLENGCEIINHTTWGHGDVYKYIETKWPGEYLIYHRALLENPETGEPDDVAGVSSFPGKISTKKAYAMKEADPYVFAAQYQNQPKAGREQSFDTAWDGFFTIDTVGQEPAIRILRTGGREGFDPTVYDPEVGDELAPDVIPLYVCEKAVILDPAPGKQSEINRDPKARNGIVVVAIDPWGRRFCLESIPARVGPTEVLELLISRYRTWAARRIGIEEVNFSALYQPLWTRIMELDPQYADVRPEFVPCYPKGRDKMQRIRDRLIPVHENHLWYYNVNEIGERAGPTGHVRKEKEEFPFGETVDLLDGLAYTDEVIARPMTPEESMRRRMRQASTDRGVTGYGW